MSKKLLAFAICLSFIAKSIAASYEVKHSGNDGGAAEITFTKYIKPPKDRSAASKATSITFECCSTSANEWIEINPDTNLDTMPSDIEIHFVSPTYDRPDDDAKSFTGKMKTEGYTAEYKGTTDDEKRQLCISTVILNAPDNCNKLTVEIKQ